MDKETFVNIIKDHQNLIYKVCNTYCYDSENKKDLEQEILVQLWNSMKKFDGRVKLSTWIYKVALNTAIGFYRKNKVYSQKNIPFDHSIISLPEIEYNSQEDDKLKMLYGFVEKLKHLDKALILLYLEDKKHIEIAEILGLSPSNVSTKINRIKESFKKQIITHPIKH